MFLLGMNVLSDLLKNHPEAPTELCYHHTVKATTLSYLLKWKFTADLKLLPQSVWGCHKSKPFQWMPTVNLSGPSLLSPPLLSEHWVTLFYAHTHTDTHTQPSQNPNPVWGGSFFPLSTFSNLTPKKKKKKKTRQQKDGPLTRLEAR